MHAPSRALVESASPFIEASFIEAPRNSNFSQIFALTMNQSELKFLGIVRISGWIGVVVILLASLTAVSGSVHVSGLLGLASALFNLILFLCGMFAFTYLTPKQLAKMIETETI